MKAMWLCVLHDLSDIIMSRTNKTEESLVFVDIESENVARTIYINTCVKGQVNLEDKKLYTIKDGITKLIDYRKRIENSHLTSFLNENCDSGLIKIHNDCQKDVSNVLKRKSNELICTTRKFPTCTKRVYQFQVETYCFYCGRHWKEKSIPIIETK